MEGEEERKSNPGDTMFMKALGVCMSSQTGCTGFLGLPIYQKLGGLKPQERILSQSWRPGILNDDVGKFGSL